MEVWVGVEVGIWGRMGVHLSGQWEGGHSGGLNTAPRTS